MNIAWTYSSAVFSNVRCLALHGFSAGDLVDVELIPAGGGGGELQQAPGFLAASRPRSDRPALGASYDFGDRRSELGARSTKSATERSKPAGKPSCRP
jgi:hypothetical protein